MSASTPGAREGVLPQAKRRAGRIDWLKWLSQLLVLVLTIGFMGPFLWAVSTSLQYSYRAFQLPIQWIPNPVYWSNYARVFRFSNIPFGLFIKNSVIITIFVVIGATVSSSAVAYGFSRFQFPGRDVLFVVLLSTMILPFQVTMIPTYVLFHLIRWLDSWKPLIVPAYFGGGAFYIFLLRQFFMTLPRELDEAAVMDGASSLTIFWRIILPLSKPAVATVALFAFMGSWNSFLGPLIYLTDSRKYTIAIGLRYFQTLPTSGTEPMHVYLMAASLIAAAPCIVLFFFAQKQFMRGIVMSGIKG